MFCGATFSRSFSALLKARRGSRLRKAPVLQSNYRQRSEEDNQELRDTGSIRYFLKSHLLMHHLVITRLYLRSVTFGTVFVSFMAAGFIQFRLEQNPFTLASGVRSALSSDWMGG